MTEAYAQQNPNEEPESSPNTPTGPWTDRVEYSEQGYAFRPNELLVLGEAGRDAATKLIRASVTDTIEIDVEQVNLFDHEWLLTANVPFDVEYVVAELRRVGYRVDPNHVLFSHNGGCCGCPCASVGANPLLANPLLANPLLANPLLANPLLANPLLANPLLANPLLANPLLANPLLANPLLANYRASGERPSTARPVEAPESAAPAIELPKKVARAFILDTGLANDPPPLLVTASHSPADAGDRDGPDESGDGYLDPASGHGTFIAGILEQLAPGQDVTLGRVLTTFGDGSAAKIAQRLVSFLPQINDQTIINMSFGGYVDTEMPTLASAIRKVQRKGAVVVASAGNDGICTPTYPAALPGVISVGSIEPQGRAPYSNYGPWVRACAPGTDLISSFFNDYNGDTPEFPGGQGPIDIDHYKAWAQWTGTSFAGPVVVAALMRHIALSNGTAKQAVAAIIDAPGLFRYPGLGTVVNLAPGM